MIRKLIAGSLIALWAFVAVAGVLGTGYTVWWKRDRVLYSGKNVVVAAFVNDVAAVGTRVVSAKPSFWTRSADYSLFGPYQLFRKTNVDLGSAALAVRRTCFEKVEGFDEALLASEDWDFCLKLREAGCDCFFDPSVEVRHDHGVASLVAIMKKAYMYGRRSGLTVQRRHHGRMTWLADS